METIWGRVHNRIMLTSSMCFTNDSVSIFTACKSGVQGTCSGTERAVGDPICQGGKGIGAWFITTGACGWSWIGYFQLTLSILADR